MRLRNIYVDIRTIFHVNPRVQHQSAVNIASDDVTSALALQNGPCTIPDSALRTELPERMRARISDKLQSAKQPKTPRCRERRAASANQLSAHRRRS